MTNTDAFRHCLEDCDVTGIRALHAQASPHLPQPADDHAALAAIHMARTQTASIAFKLRAYSHRWLTDNGLPSQLPDELKPKADRIYPKIVQAVGISINYRAPEMKPVGDAIQAAMSDAVEDCFANGDRDPVLVSARMAEAQAKTKRQIFGPTGLFVIQALG